MNAAKVISHIHIYSLYIERILMRLTLIHTWEQGRRKKYWGDPLLRACFSSRETCLFDTQAEFELRHSFKDINNSNKMPYVSNRLVS